MLRLMMLGKFLHQIMMKYVEIDSNANQRRLFQVHCNPVIFVIFLLIDSVDLSSMLNVDLLEQEFVPSSKLIHSFLKLTFDHFYLTRFPLIETLLAVLSIPFLIFL